jgi:predicted enzyme related to lactoylglutathione lyase
MDQVKYAPGTFSWVDLGTTDANAAKKFYGGLFGWTFDDQPSGPGMTYSMCKLGDEHVCALYTMDKAMAGMPPFWLSYVTVEDADATAKKVAQNGGKVMKEPFDVMTFGRMAVITDPSGGSLAVWQAKQHSGASVKQKPGTLCWNELYTTNVDAAGKFYVNTFGWKTESVDMGPMGTYTLFQHAGAKKDSSNSENAGGMMPMPPSMKGVPSSWVAYFAVTDCDASTKKATELGGKVLAPPMDIPNIGRFSMVQDPQGAAFALFKSAH